MPYHPPRYPHHPPTDHGARHPVIIVGGGMVGLATALDLAQRNIPVVLLDDDDTVSIGSRAICHAKRSLEYLSRLGLGDALLAKGVTWNTGRVFAGENQVFAFDLQQEAGHEFPAFINLQQYHLEELLVQACQSAGVDLRWKHRVTHATPDGTLTIETPHGPTTLHADWLLAADGARSEIRRSLNLPFVGKVFQDRFLIADVTMQAPFPAERWFWFDPPFHPGGSVLLHRQADNVWRIDFQLGWNADPEEEKRPENVRPRVQAMLGPNTAFELEWVSVYTFRCRRLENFRHNRILFLGDAAHQVSPFGARGGNGGLQDADNLAWKLAAVLNGNAPETLLDTYDAERIPAADENILNSTRSTDFITPKNEAAHAYRAAILELAAHHPFARPLVNSGRLSRPATYLNSPLNTPDDATWQAGPPPGTPAPDAPTDEGWLLRRLPPTFCALSFGPAPALGLPTLTLPPQGPAATRYGASAGDLYFLRPDHHIAARWHRPTPAQVAAAHRRALCQS
ncbi:MAG: FAD-dependent oxidoreductase [Alphaproteobacteria bacterium]|nr:FAD-dependent oxidoreductase [Alphaproteobacteria bacterium]